MEFRTSSMLPEGYTVNEDGEVKNPDGKTLRNFDKNRVGYVRIGIRVKQKLNRTSVHRLVADAFIPNPDNLPQVNHKNGVKDDNRLENLEWMSPSANMRHALRTGLFVPNTKGMLDHNKKNGVWNKGKKAGDWHAKSIEAKKKNALERAKEAYGLSIGGMSARDIGEEMGKCTRQIHTYIQQYKQILQHERE